MNRLLLGNRPHFCALELHRRVVAGKMDDVSEVHPGRSCRVEGPKNNAWGFYYVRFEVSTDGRAWERLPAGNTADSGGPRFGWSAKRFSIPSSPGDHEARARVVCRTGVKGPASWVRLRLK